MGREKRFHTVLPRCLLTTLVLASMARGLDLNDCRTSLGMQTHDIPDSALSASSSLDPLNLGPASARIRTESNGGAWCPQKSVSKDVYEFLQIDFNHLKVITLVETQGRFGHGQGQEYTEQYLLEFQREDEGRWFRFRNRRGHEIFQGNTNTYIAELRELEPVIIARRLRFVPYSTHPKTVCLRVEVYGCNWEDGVVSYSIPQGEKRGSEVDLYDFTYDGTIREKYMFGGLGQLTDGREGQSNFRLDPLSLGIKGYEWVGWRNETLGPNPLELVFKFDAVRNFSAVKIHTNNMFSKEARVFNEARVYFGMEAGPWTSHPVEFTYTRDPLIEYARTVTIPLENNVGRFVKIQLFFDSKWLMISEVQFESVYTEGNFTDLVSSSSGDGDDSSSRDSVRVVEFVAKQGTNKTLNQEHGKRVFPTDKPLSTVPTVTSEKDDFSLDSVRPASRLDDEYIGIVIGSLAALIVLLTAVFVIEYLRHRNCNYGCASSDFFTTDISKSSILVSMAPPPSSSSPRPNTLPKVNQTKQPSLSTGATDSLSSGGINPYATIDLPKGNSSGSSDGPSSNSATQQPFPGISWPVAEDYSIIEYPKDSLKPVKKLGDGHFGDVYLCEVRCLAEVWGSVRADAEAASMLVAVRMLSAGSDDQTRMNFRKEIMTLSRMKDRNLLGLLGICSSAGEGQCGIVQEYMQFGDLKTYLQRHANMADEVTSTKKRRSVTLLSYGCLVYLASQIASGMKFLESLNIVHRDLAARNCLVGANFVVKVTDLGSARSSHSADYYQLDDRAFLPIRWMAWEAVVLGKFSTRSDVWAFGVTLWEILSLGKEQPFESLTDDHVIENCGHLYAADGLELQLPQPPACPREIYDLMLECWQRDVTQRPSFREIHMFLTQKIAGYDPRDEQLEFEV